MDRITDVLKAVRRHIKKAEGENIDWRAVIDSLRPATQEIWLNLPVAEKKYFKQHLSRYWNVARHRMPVEAKIVLDRMQAEGRLHILKGRLKQINLDGRFDVEYRTEGIENQVAVDAIINCIGSESNFEKLDTPLVKKLFSRGYIRNDALNLGIDALPNGVVVGKNGDNSEVIYTLGTALKGILWESTAIPEIRSQARNLARTLLSE